MKKYYLLLLSFLYLIILFFKCFYSDNILYYSYILYIIVVVILTLLFCILLSQCIVKTFISKEYINIISIIILLLSIVLFFAFPFRFVKTKYDLNKYEDKRIEIINLVKNNELSIDNIGNAILPKEYKNYSQSGEVFVYQNDDNNQVIGFLVFRGMLSGSTELIYSTGGEDLIRKNETGHPIVEIKKLKDYWYYVVTDY